MCVVYNIFHALSPGQSRKQGNIDRKHNVSAAMFETSNIAAETLCFLSMFPCLPISGNIVEETKLLPRKQQCMQAQALHKNSCELMFLTKCFLFCPRWET